MLLIEQQGILEVTLQNFTHFLLQPCILVNAAFSSPLTGHKPCFKLTYALGLVFYLDLLQFARSFVLACVAATAIV